MRSPCDVCFCWSYVRRNMPNKWFESRWHVRCFSYRTGWLLMHGSVTVMRIPVLTGITAMALRLWSHIPVPKDAPRFRLIYPAYIFSHWILVKICTSGLGDSTVSISTWWQIGTVYVLLSSMLGLDQGFYRLLSWKKVRDVCWYVVRGGGGKNNHICNFVCQ